MIEPSHPFAAAGNPMVAEFGPHRLYLGDVAGQTVCDPFMGTGSTGVAAIKAGKTFIGIEHNHDHFETACLRIEAAWQASKEITHG